MNIVVNPIQATASANYMGILLWAVIFGIALKKVASDNTKQMLSDFSDAVSMGVKWIINLAPFGICGTVFIFRTKSSAVRIYSQKAYWFYVFP